MRKSVLLILVLVLALAAAPAGATSPDDVEFSVETSFLPTGETGGPFVATGPAVDAGLMCPTGDTIDIFGKVSAFETGVGFNIQLGKLFTCDDGSGEFVLKLQIRIDPKGVNFNWLVVDGSGAYERLRGTGSGVGLPDLVAEVLDIYTGKLHSN
jgi:hypothetical protein